MTKHTPTPWNLEQLYKTDGDMTISANLGTWNKPFIGTIAKVSSSYGSMDAGECYENAKHIVKCVNMHDELINALESAYATINQLGYLSQDKLYKHDLENINNVLVKARRE